MPTIKNPTDLHPAWADRFNAADVDGMLALAGTTADVARRSEDHNWRYVLDNPFGTA